MAMVADRHTHTQNNYNTPGVNDMLYMYVQCHYNVIDAMNYVWAVIPIHIHVSVSYVANGITMLL